MAEKRYPYMPFYVADFIGGTRLMSDAARGVYIVILCILWENGPLPNDVKVIDRVAPGAKRHWSEILPKLSVMDDGSLSNDRLEHERRFLMKQSDNGSLGGRPRKPKPEPKLKPKPEPKADPKPKASSSSSTSDSEISESLGSGKRRTEPDRAPACVPEHADSGVGVDDGAASRPKSLREFLAAADILARSQAGGEMTTRFSAVCQRYNADPEDVIRLASDQFGRVVRGRWMLHATYTKTPSRGLLITDFGDFIDSIAESAKKAKPKERPKKPDRIEPSLTIEDAKRRIEEARKRRDTA